MKNIKEYPIVQIMKWKCNVCMSSLTQGGIQMYFFKNKVDYEELYKKELQKNNDLKNECLELKSTINNRDLKILELQERLRQSNEEYIKLQNKLNSYNANLKPKKKKVNFDLVNKVEYMIEIEKLTYREISDKLNISTKTISRIKNGYYKNKL